MSNFHHIPGRTKKLPPLRVGVGGPVGSGKTTLLEMLCKTMREQYDLVVITNDGKASLWSDQIFNHLILGSISILILID